MSKNKISYQYNFKCKIIAICSHLKEYRASFYINDALDIVLQKEDDLFIDDKQSKDSQKIDNQYYNDKEHELEYFLIHNKSNGVHFLSSLKKFDYLLLIKSEHEIEHYDEFIKKLNAIQHFQIVYKVTNLPKREKNLIDKYILYPNLE